jgi:hypothetical protein
MDLAPALVLLWWQRHWVFWASDRSGHQVIHTGWWTSDHLLALTNGLLAAAALTAIFVSWNATSRTLKRSDAQLTLDTNAFRSNTQPILVETADATKCISTDLQSNLDIVVSVFMRNVGKGPAFVRKAEFVSGRTNPDEAAVAAKVVIPVDEETRITYTLKSGSHFHKLFLERSEFAVALNYDDISGDQRTRSVMRIRHMDDDTFDVLGVGLYHCGKDEAWTREREPFAGFDPRAQDIVADDSRK